MSWRSNDVHAEDRIRLLQASLSYMLKFGKKVLREVRLFGEVFSVRGRMGLWDPFKEDMGVIQGSILQLGKIVNDSMRKLLSKELDDIRDLEEDLRAITAEFDRWGVADAYKIPREIESIQGRLQEEVDKAGQDLVIWERDVKGFKHFVDIIALLLKHSLESVDKVHGALDEALVKVWRNRVRNKVYRMHCYLKHMYIGYNRFVKSVEEDGFVDEELFRHMELLQNYCSKDYPTGDDPHIERLGREYAELQRLIELLGKN